MISMFDLFGSELNLKMDKVCFYKTTLGGLCSIGMAIIISIQFVTSFISFINQEKVTVTSEKQYDPDPDPITFGADSLMFSMNIYQAFQIFKDTPLFNIRLSIGEFHTIDGQLTMEYHDVSLEPCTEAHFKQYFQVYKKNITSELPLLTTHVCPPVDMKWNLQGQFTSRNFFFVRIQAVKCNQAELDTWNPNWKATCAGDAAVAAHLATFGQFRLSTYHNNFIISADKQDYTDTYLNEDLSFQFIPNQMYKSVDIFFREYEVHTETNSIGSSVLTDEKFLIQEYMDFRESTLIGRSDEVYTEFFLRRSPFSINLNRKHQTFTEFLSSFGGFINILITCIGIFIRRYNYFSFTVDLANKLYTLKSDKAAKHKKDQENYNSSVTPTQNNKNNLSILNNKNELHNDIVNYYNSHPTHGNLPAGNPINQQHRPSIASHLIPSNPRKSSMNGNVVGYNQKYPLNNNNNNNNFNPINKKINSSGIGKQQQQLQQLSQQQLVKQSNPIVERARAKLWRVVKKIKQYQRNNNKSNQNNNTPNMKASSIGNSQQAHQGSNSYNRDSPGQRLMDDLQLGGGESQQLSMNQSALHQMRQQMSSECANPASVAAIASLDQQAVPAGAAAVTILQQQSQREFLMNRFKAFLKQTSHRVTAGFGYFVQKLSCSILYRSPANRTLDNAIDYVARDLDIFVILRQLQEIEKIKKIIFSGEQNTLLAFSPKPEITPDSKLANLDPSLAASSSIITAAGLWPTASTTSKGNHSQMPVSAEQNQVTSAANLPQHAKDLSRFRDQSSQYKPDDSQQTLQQQQQQQQQFLPSQFAKLDRIPKKKLKKEIAYFGQYQTLFEAFDRIKFKEEIKNSNKQNIVNERLFQGLGSELNAIFDLSREIQSKNGNQANNLIKQHRLNANNVYNNQNNSQINLPIHFEESDINITPDKSIFFNGPVGPVKKQVSVVSRPAAITGTTTAGVGVGGTSATAAATGNISLLNLSSHVHQMNPNEMSHTNSFSALNGSHLFSNNNPIFNQIGKNGQQQLQQRGQKFEDSNGQSKNPSLLLDKSEMQGMFVDTIPDIPFEEVSQSQFYSQIDYPSKSLKKIV